MMGLPRGKESSELVEEYQKENECGRLETRAGGVV